MTSMFRQPEKKSSSECQVNFESGLCYKSLFIFLIGRQGHDGISRLKVINE